jgi:hypothetical protein
MSAAFTNEDRQRGFQTMTAQLSPGARVRRRFLQGGVSKQDVLLSAPGAINAAVEALTEVVGYIEAKELTLSRENAAVVLVYSLKGGPAKYSQVFPDKRAHGLLNRLAVLPHFSAIGLILFVQELVDGSLRVSSWTKPFLWGADNVETLNKVREEKLLPRFGKGEWLIQ